MVDLVAIRAGIAALDSSVSHAASGLNRPVLGEIFAPLQHAGALDPNTSIVMGARGTGKSFWAGVLGDSQTRAAASPAYPNLNLDKLKVRFGYTGLSRDGSVSRATLDSLVPFGQERVVGTRFWRCVVLRALIAEIEGIERGPTVNYLIERYSDPEEWEEECERVDDQLSNKGGLLLIIFDALDSLSEDWVRLRDLIDALLEVAWSIKGYKSLRVKLFLRPDQLRDLGLRFVELPKLIAGAATLNWAPTNLYGMFFARLGNMADDDAKGAFAALLSEVDVSPVPKSLARLRRWELSVSRTAQARVFTRMAGNFMGRSNKKGRTYDWPINHLADGHGEVTPRSFMSLMIAAARHSGAVTNQVLTAQAIKSGLREASKVRVNQLELEFPWVKRVLAPLARLQVPCTVEEISSRWNATETIEAINARALAGDFLPPIVHNDQTRPENALIERLVRIGILVTRTDGRYDMPDLFRVAARLLKKGGVSPSGAEQGPLSR